MALKEWTLEGIAADIESQLARWARDLIAARGAQLDSAWLIRVVVVPTTLPRTGVRRLYVIEDAPIAVGIRVGNVDLAQIDLASRVGGRQGKVARDGGITTDFI